MFCYLDVPDMQQKILSLPWPSHVVLSSAESVILKSRLEKLNLLPVDQPHMACMELRRLVLEYDEELFALMKEKLYTPVVGGILDQMGCPHQFLPAESRPARRIRRSERRRWRR